MIETIIHPPQSLPLSLLTVKGTLRLNTTSQDDRLTSLIESAATWIEGLTQKALVTQTRRAIIELSSSHWYKSLSLPHGVIKITLPTGPLIELEEVLFQGEAVNAYKILGKQHILFPSLSHPGELSLQYRVGYGPTEQDIPSPLRQAILMAVVRFYEDMVFPMEKEVRTLINPFKPFTIH